MGDWFKPVVFWSNVMNRWHGRNSRGVFTYFREWKKALEFALGKENSDGEKSWETKQDAKTDAESTGL